MSTPFEKGFEAYNNRVDPENNPYPKNSHEYSEWNDGWDAGAEAEEEI
jgi:hypothetical protein